MKVGAAIGLVVSELKDASNNYPRFNSHHEGLAVIREEYLELEAEVFKKDTDRSRIELRKEAIQLAAMAIRFLVDVT